MEKGLIERINALAKKARETGLAEQELAEQKKLREKYVLAFRNSLKTQLDQIILVDKNGNETPLEQTHKPQ